MLKIEDLNLKAIPADRQLELVMHIDDKQVKKALPNLANTGYDAKSKTLNLNSFVEAFYEQNENKADWKSW